MDGRSGNHKPMAQISATCRKARRRSESPRYPDEIKRQVQQLVKDGVKASVIARSTGLSYSVVRNWSKSESLPLEPVRVLPVVNDRREFKPSGEPVLMFKTNDLEIAVFCRI